jgi:hypothetical protein
MLKPSGKAVCNTSKKIEPIVDGRSTTCKRNSTLLKCLSLDGHIEATYRQILTCKYMSHTQLQAAIYGPLTHRTILVSTGWSLMYAVMNAHHREKSLKEE